MEMLLQTSWRAIKSPVGVS